MNAITLFCLGCIGYALSWVVSLFFEIPVATVFAYLVVGPFLLALIAAALMFVVALIIKLLR
ncbi:hypothetical protein [Diaphorobacter caeni]|uniref:hypothetical protein n=1 Tax=Diaphorobacter caeni TaxID=2784387 RepID=UPI00188DE27C|nr:hypothetical protein [Diaphorobacter caeni]MBF5006830.1 hypothetical protein [Diaphorobacter caeni]